MYMQKERIRMYYCENSVNPIHSSGRSGTSYEDGGIRYGINRIQKYPINTVISKNIDATRFYAKVRGVKSSIAYSDRSSTC